MLVLAHPYISDMYEALIEVATFPLNSLHSRSISDVLGAGSISYIEHIKDLAPVLFICCTYMLEQ